MRLGILSAGRRKSAPHFPPMLSSAWKDTKCDISDSTLLIKYEPTAHYLTEYFREKYRAWEGIGRVSVLTHPPVLLNPNTNHAQVFLRSGCPVPSQKYEGHKDGCSQSETSCSGDVLLQSLAVSIQTMALNLPLTLENVTRSCDLGGKLLSFVDS